jgi:glutamine amidotransferase-like uncharacterized protein
MRRRRKGLVAMSGIVLPYEPQYVGHRNAEDRRKAVSEWLRQRERELDEHHSPSVVPEEPPTGERPSTGEKA